MLCPAYLQKPNKCIKSIQSFTEIRKLNAYALSERALLPDVNETNHNTLTRDQLLDIVSPSGGGGLIGMGGMGI